MLMRRLAAILLVAWFSFSLIGPVVLAADAQSNLSACCRRNGQHHCTASSQGLGSRAGWRAARCPAFPAAKALPAARQAIAPAHAPAAAASLPTYPVVPVRSAVLRRTGYDRTGQKRGPPLFLL
jgi:hypothetical protein